MKKIEFLKQGMENFCNHIDPIEVDFTNGNITMITGPNGIGKTSIFQSIPYTLYGNCEKGRGEDVLNDKIKKNCHTWTEFKIDDVPYRVDRYVKYTRIGNSVSITKGDDTKPYLKGHSEVVPEIEKLLMPYKIFMNTLLFSQKVKSFFTDLGDAEQKEIFRKIMGLDDYVLYGQTCNLELKALNEKVVAINQSIAVFKGIIESTIKQKNEFIEKKKEFEVEKQRNIVKYEEEIVRLNETILVEVEKQKWLPEDTSKETSEINSNLRLTIYKLENLGSIKNNKIETLKNQAELKVSELETNFLQLSSKTLEDNNTNQRLENEKSQEEQTRLKDLIDSIDKKIQDLNIKKEGVNTSISHLNINLSNLTFEDDLTECPTCKREINDECIEHLSKLKAKSEGEISYLQDGLIVIDREIEVLNNQKTSLAILLNQEKEKLRATFRMYEVAYRDDLSQLTERKTIAVNKVNSMIDEMKEKIQEENKLEIEKLNKEITIMELKLEELGKTQKIIDDFNEAFQELVQSKHRNENQLNDCKEVEFDNSLIENCDKSIKESQLKIESVLKERVVVDEQIKMVDFWKTGFSSSGIQSMLIDEAIPFMNKQISYYMGLIAGGRYQVTFDTLKATKDAKEFRDKISVNVFDSQTHSDKRVKFSGGQTRIVDIGTILTLADLQANIQNTSVNIILFDEIFDALDSENIRYVSNLLRLIGKEKWVGIISHTKIDDIEADNVLEFR